MATALARDVLHEGIGAFADERDGDRLGTDAVARDAGAAWEALKTAE
jgi:hypothetical protein